MNHSNDQPNIGIPPAFRSARLGLPDEVVIIARWDDEQSQVITIQDFIQDGKPFVPVFSDGAAFDDQIKGSGFEDQGVFIKTDFLFSILKGGEHLILDPGGEKPRWIELPEL